MTIKSKIAAAVAIATVAASLTIPTSAAQARGGWGVGLGVGLGVAAVANSAAYGGYYVDGVRRCGWERQYDSYGYYVGTVKVCRVY